MAALYLVIILEGKKRVLNLEENVLVYMNDISFFKFLGISLLSVLLVFELLSSKHREIVYQFEAFKVAFVSKTGENFLDKPFLYLVGFFWKN